MIMNNWIETFLGDNISHKKGFAFKSQSFIDEGIPVVKVTDFTDDSVNTNSLNYIDENLANDKAQYQLKVDDSVVQTVGSWPNNPASVVGKTIKVPSSLDGALLNQNAVILRPKDMLDKNFLFYLLKSDMFKGYIINTAQGAANQASITLDSIFRFPFYRPSSEIQQKIAAILLSYDDLIENNKRRIAILEKMAEEIYREWFVRFRFPNYQNTEFEKGIPKGWEVKKLPEIADITYGFPFQANRFNELGMGKPIIRIRNIPNSNTNDFTDEVVNEKYLVNTGDFIVGMDGEFHMNHWYGEEAYLVQRVCKIIAKETHMSGYLSRALKDPIKHYESILLGATVGHLGAKHLNDIDILIPPKELHQKMLTFNQLELQKKNLALINVNLKKTRNQLLPRLISGKLSVENLDIQFPPSMCEEA